MANTLRWLVGVFIILPLLTGGAYFVLYGVIEVHGAMTLGGLAAVWIGWTGMEWLQKHP